MTCSYQKEQFLPFNESSRVIEKTNEWEFEEEKIGDLHWLGKGEKKVLSFFGFKSQNPWKKIVFLCPTKLIINYELCESKRSSSQLDHNLHFRAPGIPFSLLKESLSLETPLLKAKNHESKKTRQSFESIWNFGLVLLVDIV